MIEQRRRTLARVLTWRLGGVVLGVLLGWFFTGSWAIGAEFGLAYNGIRAFTHYFHERFWLLYVRWGREDLEPPKCSVTVSGDAEIQGRAHMRTRLEEIENDRLVRSDVF